MPAECEHHPRVQGDAKHSRCLVVAMAGFDAPIFWGSTANAIPSLDFFFFFFTGGGRASPFRMKQQRWSHPLRPNAREMRPVVIFHIRYEPSISLAGTTQVGD